MISFRQFKSEAEASDVNFVSKQLMDVYNTIDDSYPESDELYEAFDKQHLLPEPVQGVAILEFFESVEELVKFFRKYEGNEQYLIDALYQENPKMKLNLYYLESEGTFASVRQTL